MDPYDPPLDTARHLRYWQRCIRTLLPHHYTSMDSTRLSLGFFIICSIDLLTPSSSPSSSSSSSGAPKPLLTPTDRSNLRRWVLSCQHPLGGFTGSPTHVFAPQYQQTDAENAHIGGTYFALLLLVLLAEDTDTAAAGAFAGVDRVATLRWLRRLQRPEDGSFGEIVYDTPALPGDDKQRKQQRESIISGGKDMRYCYLAAAVRWMLRGNLDPSHPEYVEDIDVPALVAHIRRGQTYDGGFAESCAQESHMGYGYCAVAALALLDRPLEGGGEGDDGKGESKAVVEGIADRKGFVAWLASRQFAYLAPEAEADDDDDDDDDDPATANFRLAELSLSDSAVPPPMPQLIGFNGRCNKVADTCYTWWTLGALAVLDQPKSNSDDDDDDDDDHSRAPVVDPAVVQAQRRFLLEKTQHIIGGFGKHPGSPPDVGHACLGLAALATMGDTGLKKLDASLCVSVEAVRRVERARRGLLLRGAAGCEKDIVDGPKPRLGDRLVDVAARMGGARPEWLNAMA